MKDHHESEELAASRNRAFAAALPLLSSGSIHTRAETDDFTLTITCDKGTHFSLRETGVLAWKRRFAGKDALAVPHVTVTCRLIDESDRSFGERVTPFMWHPFLSHYRALWQTPEAGMYRFEVEVNVTRDAQDSNAASHEKLRMVLGPVVLND